MSALNDHAYEFRLYPPVQQVDLVPGDSIHVRATNHTRGPATVVCAPDGGRVTVRLARGVQAQVRVNRCTQVISLGPNLEVSRMTICALCFMSWLHHSALMCSELLQSSILPEERRMSDSCKWMMADLLCECMALCRQSKGQA
jgi:hypothetical protein